MVTGAAGGIGAAVSRTLAAQGRAVAILDCDGRGLAAREQEMVAAGGTVVGLVTNVADGVAVEAAVAAAEDQLGQLDVLVNAAGVLRTGQAVDIDPASWARSFAVNTDGVLHASAAVGRRMRDRGRGSIVTVASNAAGVPRSGMAAYAASKAAAMMFTRCLGLELASAGVRCNIVCPGSTDTPMLRELFPNGEDRACAAAAIAGSPVQYRVGIPLGRVADPEDIADAVAFLCSDRARHITMQALYVDGGATLRA